MDRVGLLPIVARWWWVLVVAALAAGAAGFVAVNRAPKTYKGEVQVLVGPINTDVALDASGALASTYADLATSEGVLQAAIKATGSSLTTIELRKATTAIANQVTRIVVIGVESGEPLRAARLANAIALNLSQLSTSVDSTSKSVLELFQDQPEFQALPERSQARVERAASRVFGPSAAGRVKVVDPALPPESPSKPVVPLVVGLSGVGGLLIAAIFLLVKEARSPRHAVAEGTERAREPAAS